MDWREAERIVGVQDRNDFILDLDAHRLRYEAKAPDLTNLMAYAGTKAHCENYAAFDKAAITAQARYRRWRLSWASRCGQLFDTHSCARTNPTTCRRGNHRSHTDPQKSKRSGIRKQVTPLVSIRW